MNPPEISTWGQIFIRFAVYLLLPTVWILLARTSSVKPKKFARRVMLTGLAMLGLEAASVSVCLLNDEYFHVTLIEKVLETYFYWLNINLLIISGILIALAGFVGLMCGGSENWRTRAEK